MVASKVTEDPMRKYLSGPALMGGAGLMATIPVAGKEPHPFASVTTRLTLNDPAPLKVCCSGGAAILLPFPKFHSQELMPVSVELNCTGLFSQSVSGRKLKEAAGLLLMAGMMY